MRCQLVVVVIRIRVGEVEGTFRDGLISTQLDRQDFEELNPWLERADEFFRNIRRVPDRTVPTLRAVRKQYSRELSSAEPETVLEIARALLRDGGDDVRLVAYELIHFHRPTLTRLTERLVVELASDMASWGAVDTFAYYISGPAWKRDQISDAAVASWIQSPDLWWRRAALVSTVALNRRPTAARHSTRTLAICASVVSDREDMVVKALSWALRELSKADPTSVKAFLRQNQRALSPRVLREVSNKLRTGLKTPRSRRGSPRIKA